MEWSEEWESVFTDSQTTRQALEYWSRRALEQKGIGAEEQMGDEAVTVLLSRISCPQ